MGNKEAEEFRKTFDAGKYADIKNSAELGIWLAGEEEKSKPKSPEEERKQNARYAFATEEIFGLAERNGPDIIPRIFAELRKKNESDISDVIRVIKTLTGEDFNERLMIYSKSR